ncbi:MAG: winged helix-turn-helix transcriptional regulator [Alphaproteobacteria bacterium]|nr:winged helix-turn-helix transcriptional regulator [Alphaproteobacteria bacterium]
MGTDAADIVNLLPLAVLRLTAAGDALHASRGLNSALRSILVTAAAQTPRTVSQMARERRVSRQYLQRAVDDLIAMGLLAALPNPGHRRAPLIALTRRGAAMTAAIRNAEAPLVAGLFAGIDGSALASTAAVLRLVCERLSAGAQGRAQPRAPARTGGRKKNGPPP